MPNRSVGRTALIVGLLCCCLAATVFVVRRGALDSSQKALIKAISRSGARPFLLRVSGAAHAPYRTPRRGVFDSPASAIAAVAHDVLARQSEVKTEKEGAHALALATLLTGKAAQSVVMLEDLTRSKDANAAVWNDLAVARHEAAIVTGDVRSLGAALAAVDRALMIDPNALEPRFNRAAILESLRIRAAAAVAWENYCRADTEAKSPWVAEAREHLSAAQEPSSQDLWSAAQRRIETVAPNDTAIVDAAIRAFPRDARSAGESLYLSAWGEAWLARRADAARSLALARLIGARLRVMNGEALLGDAVAAIDRAIAEGFGDSAARAHVTYREARLLVRDRKPREAVPILARAEHEFAAIRSPMALSARYYRAAALFDERHAEEATTQLASVWRWSAPEYFSLRAGVVGTRTPSGATG